MASKKWRWLVALLILGTSLVLPLKGSVLAHQVAWPFVEPQVRAKVAGDVITYTIWLKNTTHAVQQNVEIRFKIPHGTTFVESGAGDLGVNRGAFDGKEVGWIQGSLAGGVRQGPFLVVVKTNPWNSEHPHETVAARAWVRWQLGSFLSKALVMQNPLMPPSMTISDEEEKRGLVHIEYFGTWRNLNDLRDQVANWAAGQDSGRRIALEKVERLEAVIQHVPWPTAKLDQFAAEIHEGLHPVEDGLTAQDVAATQAALQKVNEAFHGLTHAFYDEWVKGTEDVVGHVMPHIVYLDISANVSDLRAQVANWEKGQDSGRRIAMEKVDRLNNVIPHVAWPGVMIGSALELKDALEPVEAGLEAQNLVATTQALAKVSDAFHSLTHAFYDKWITSQRGMMAHAVVHASYQDIWLNVNDLRAQVANWEKGQDSGRRIALEKVDRLEALIPHVAWPREMKHPIDELHEGIEGAEKGLTAQDVAATKEALSMVSEAFHELTHEFYESIEPRRPAATTEMAPGMPMETMAPETAPALDPALVAQGRTLFATKGCSVCHGANGEGGIGPRLAGHFHSSDLITSIVRNGSGAMPAFAPAQISDGDLAAIVAFVQSLAQ